MQPPTSGAAVRVSMQPATSSGAVRVLCYGDSLTAGYTALTKYTGEYAPWATHLGDALGLPVDHVGMCGWTTEQMVDGLDGEANVDVCDVAHRGLRRLLEEGGYTHVRQQWLPVFCAQPAARQKALVPRAMVRFAIGHTYFKSLFGSAPSWDCFYAIHRELCAVEIKREAGTDGYGASNLARF